MLLRVHVCGKKSLAGRDKIQTMFLAREKQIMEVTGWRDRNALG